jgi:hypothetical protein
MPFNINEFKSTMNKYGGPARKNLFVMEIASVPALNDGISLRDLRFFCQTVQAPAINFNVTDYYPNGFGVRQSIPTQMAMSPFNAVFMLDSDHQILRFFHQWMQNVINYDFSRGGYVGWGDQLPYEVGYVRDISTRITIKSYSTDSQTNAYEYVLEDAYPTEISGETLSWSDNDSFSTATVNFTYSHVSVSGLTNNPFSDRNTRGSGLLDLVNRVGTTGQVINQGRLPTSIQDAVNAFTRINTGIANVNNGFSQVRTGLNSIGNIFR